MKSSMLKILKIIFAQLKGSNEIGAKTRAKNGEFGA
jgi:hypothetical protein